LPSSLSFLLVFSPSYLLSCVLLRAFFPDPTFFVHLPFPLSFFYFHCLRFLHPIFLPLLKNLSSPSFLIPSLLYLLYCCFPISHFYFFPFPFSSFAMVLSFFCIFRSCFVRSLSMNIFSVSLFSLSFFLLFML
jgi:hypothetical protein